MLPPSREPGLWSGDGPTAALPAGEPRLFGVLLPFADDASTDEEKAPTYACAVVLNQHFLALGDGPQRLARLSALEQRCAAAMLFAYCTDVAFSAARSEHMAVVLNTARFDERPSAEAQMKRHASARRAGEAFEKLACAGVRFHSLMGALIRDINMGVQQTKWRMR